MSRSYLGNQGKSTEDSQSKGVDEKRITPMTCVWILPTETFAVLTGSHSACGAQLKGVWAVKTYFLSYYMI